MKFVPLEEAEQEQKPLTFVPLETKAEPAKEIDPTTGKPYPELRALPDEPSIWDRVMMWGGDNKAKSANEFAARRTAAERKIPLSEAYKVTPAARRPTFNPEGRPLGQAVTEAGTALAKSLPDVPEAAANTALRAIRAGDIPVEDRTWLDRAITATTLEPQGGDLNTQAFANVGQSLGYSTSTMVASAIAAAGGTAAAGPLGGVAAGVATSGAVSYGASKDEFLSRLKTKLDKDSKRTFGRPLNEEEWNDAKKEFDGAASKYGAWEAIPEAVSNLIFLKVFLAPVKAAKTAEKVAEYAKRATIAQGPEHITETITALGQNKAEREAGLSKEELDLKAAFMQQFVATLVTTGALGAGAAAAQQINSFYENYVEPKVRPGSALAKAIQADLVTYANQPTPVARDREQAAISAPGIAPPPIQVPVEDPRVQTLAQSYQEQGMPPEQAQQQAQEEITSLELLPVTDAEGRGVQRKSAEDEARTMAGRAERTMLQMEGENVPTTEPPPFVTEPSTDERGVPLPSGVQPAAGGPASPINRGLDAARRASGELAGREEAERAALDKQREIAERTLAQGFNREAYPDLGIILGASWVRSTLAKNPTPEEYQDAAYARLEELNGQPPADAGPAFERRAPAVPAVGERPEAVSKPAAAPAPTEVVEAPAAAEAAEPIKSAKEKIFDVQRTQPEAKTGDAITFNLPWVPGGYEVSGIVGKSRYLDSAGREVSADTPGAKRHVEVTYKVDGEQITNPFDVDTLRLNTIRFEEKPDLTKPTEKPSVTETPKAVEAKEEKPAKPAERAAPTEFEPLELEAGRKQEIEVDPAILSAVNRVSDEKIKQQLITEFGVTATGEVRKRRPGGGAKERKAKKTEEERGEQATDIVNDLRDTLAEISAARKLERSTKGDLFGIVGRTAEEVAYREALRDLSLEVIRAGLYKTAQKFKARPIVAYGEAGKYIKSLKPDEQERAKALAEGKANFTTLPPLPPTLSTPAQRKKAIEKIKAAEEEAVAEPVKEARQAKPEVPAEVEAVVRPVTEAFGTPLWLNEYAGLYEERGAEARRKERSRVPEEKTKWTDFNARLLAGHLSKADRQELKLEEEPVDDAQQDLQDAAIHDQLDAEDKAVIAEHYGENSYNEVAKRKFVEDVVRAMNEGLESVSRVLHDIIKRLQAGMLAAVMVLNTSFYTPTIPVATPTTVTKTVQVRATVPADVVGMSEGAKQAYEVLYPALKTGLQATNKLFIITDKPSATLYVFKPDGKLIVQSKVLLGKTVGDFYKGNTEIVQNRITTAGLFTMGLRDAARGGSEAKTAGAYDFGKVFVLDKAINGEYSVTLFHSVWTKEKDAKQRLTALEKPGPTDSRYSFGCINVAKGVYGSLLAGHENQIDGAKLFIVPENPAHTMDFINGKSVYAGDIVRQAVEPVTAKVEEKVPPTAPKEERREETAIREEKALPRRAAAPSRKKPLSDKEEQLARSIADGTLDAKEAKKISHGDLIDFTRLAGEIAAAEHSREADKAFTKFETLAQALEHIVDTGTPLDAGIAKALLANENEALVENVDLVTTKPARAGQKPTSLQEFVQGAFGAYSPYGDRTGGVVVLEDSGKAETGINNLTVLHEGVHAATTMKLYYVEHMIKAGRAEEIDPQLLEGYDELNELMYRANDVAAGMMRDNTLPRPVAALAAKDAFTDVHEFVAYGLTDENMKAFLLTVPGIGTKKSGLSRFVSALLKLLQIGKDNVSALRDLVISSSKIMEAKTPSAEAMVEAAKEAMRETENEAKQAKKNIQDAERDLKASRSTRAIIGNVGRVQSAARSPNILSRFLERSLAGIDVASVKGAINTLPTSSLFRIGIANGIYSLEVAQKQYRYRGMLRHQVHVEMDALVRRWIKLGKKQQMTLADAMHLSTDIQEDPSLPAGTRSRELATLWQQLTPEGKQLYKDVRDFYKKGMNAFLATMKQRIANSMLSGNINDQSTPKGKLYAEIVQTYEDAMGKGPYFPLMRHGNFWVRFGKGKNMNFQMFESATAQTKFIQDQIAERRKLGDARSMAELETAGEAEKGYDINILREKIADEVSSVKRLFTAIDSTNFGSKAEIEELKKDIFQMNLLLMPERSMRKLFTPRKNRAGYSSDALRSFVIAGGKIANGLAGARYDYKIADSFKGAMDSLKMNPDKAKLELLVKEIQYRIGVNTRPMSEDSVMDDFARIANKATFVNLLTDFKQVFNNVWSLPSKGLPTLLKYFNIGDITKETASMMKYGGFNQVGITKVLPNGNIKRTMPSFGSSAVVRNSQELQYAVRMMEELEASGRGTMTTDVYFAERHKATTLKGAIFDTIVRVTGALNQGSERITRELMYLTTYKLLRRQGLKPQDAALRALDITEESLYRYAPDEVPPILNKWGPRIVFQFKKYSAFTVNYYLMNMAEVTGKLPSQHRAGAVWAIMGSYMMAIVGAGLGGAFGFSTMAWLLGLVNDWWEKNADNNMKKTLANISPMRWFNEVYLPKEFGDMKVPGTDMLMSDVLARGLLNTLSGSDMGASISEGSMWFHELPTSLDLNEILSMVDARNMLGPSAGVLYNVVYSGMQDWARGDTAKAYEKWMPIKLFRSPMVAERLRTEGLKDKDYNDVIKAREFTEGQLYRQALGFRPEAVARIEDMNFFVKAHEKKILDQKERLVGLWVDNTIRNRKEGTSKALKNINDFNRMYPYDEKLQIDADALDDALDRKLEKKEDTLRGLEVLEKPEFDWLEKYRREAKRTIRENAPKRSDKETEQKLKFVPLEEAAQ